MASKVRIFSRLARLVKCSRRRAKLIELEAGVADSSMQVHSGEITGSSDEEHRALGFATRIPRQDQ